jgi:anti-anti-sigma regulatory factor
MLAVAPGCELDVERGPDWLLVRVVSLDKHSPEAPSLAEELWSLMQRHFTYRLVLELDGVPALGSELVAQLGRLHDRIVDHGGVMRLCGLSPRNLRLLRAQGLDDRFLPYRDRHEAVMGCLRPRQPK